VRSKPGGGKKGKGKKERENELFPTKIPGKKGKQGKVAWMKTGGDVEQTNSATTIGKVWGWGWEKMKIYAGKPLLTGKKKNNKEGKKRGDLLHTSTEIRKGWTTVTGRRGRGKKRRKVSQVRREAYQKKNSKKEGEVEYYLTSHKFPCQGGDYSKEETNTEHLTGG